jgi:hypothetical protein
MPPKPSWRVTCCCGWERECSSEWAANSAAKLHPEEPLTEYAGQSLNLLVDI